jgi:hypothetical protein
MDTLSLDDLMPAFDATRIEHRVIDAPPAAVYEAVLHADLVEAVRRNLVVTGLFAARAAAERVASALRRAPATEPPDMATMRLGDLSDHGEWVRLADDAPHELAFGAIGRFWGGETSWLQIDAAEFASFDTPGFAKIAAGISLRPYGRQRTLVSYEARTRATDDAARRSFLRYWSLVSPGVGIVMRAALALIADEARGTA